MTAISDRTTTPKAIIPHGSHSSLSAAIVGEGVKVGIGTSVGVDSATNTAGRSRILAALSASRFGPGSISLIYKT